VNSFILSVRPSRCSVTPQKEKVPEKEGPETPPDSPLLDLSDAAVKKLMRSAKKRGYVTHDQISSLSPEEHFSRRDRNPPLER
jgi:Sigma-70 factor, region 1.1